MIKLLDISPYAMLPLSCGVIVIIVGYLKLWKLRKREQPETVPIFGIWLIGIIGFLLGIYGQILTMMDTFDSISEAGDISPSIVAGGIKGSYRSTLVGIAVLIISLVIWGILKSIKQKRSNLKQ